MPPRLSIVLSRGKRTGGISEYSEVKEEKIDSLEKIENKKRPKYKTANTSTYLRIYSFLFAS